MNRPAPTFAADTCALDAPQLAALRDFILRHWCDGAEDLATAIRTAILCGGGSWIDRDTGPRPASHLVEINLHGATATGMSMPEAVQNWRRVAERLALGAAA